MDSINSISKGVFVFKNGPSIKNIRKRKHPDIQEVDQEWHKNFKEAWHRIEEDIERIQSESYSKTLQSLISFIRDTYKTDQNLQTAVLLTGVNQTDHLKQFDMLALKIVNNCFAITSILRSRDCPNVKTAIEILVGGLINEPTEVEDENETDNVKLKKKQLTLPVLQAWFDNKYSKKLKPTIVIMMADFEQFNPHVLQELIIILTSYCNRLPIVLILGVATAFQTIHNILPFHITSKITANVFQAESSTSMLNRILDEVILTHQSPFYLSGKSFKILMDIFLFYDYSLNSFIQGYKVFMLEHFSGASIVSSIYYRKAAGCFDDLTHEDCDKIRRSFASFRKYVEEQRDPQVRIDLITNDETLKKKLMRQVKRTYRYFYEFFCCLRMLAVLIEDLPRNNLGKLYRELYPLCAASDITKLEEYQECFKLLRFSSKDKFIAKLDKIKEILGSYDVDDVIPESLKINLREFKSEIEKFYENILSAGMTPIKEKEKTTQKLEINKKGVVGRQEMLEKLKESAKQNQTRVVIEYEKKLIDCIDYFNSIFEKYLSPFTKAPHLSEMFIFSNCSSVRRQIVGTPRGSLHNALSNPQHYLQCSCCEIKEDQVLLPTLPDICIAYKLHLECSKFINLFDWLQAFAMVIKNNHEDDDEISPEIHARFIQATSELQFLGLIKQAKHKTDHVMRLTW